MAAIVAGVVVLGVTAHAQAAKISLAEMIAFLIRPQAVIYTALLFAGVVAPIAYSRTKKYAHGDIAFGLGAGFLLAIGQIYSKAFMSGFSKGQHFGVTTATFAWWIFLLLLFIGNLGNMLAMQYGFQKGKAVVVGTLAQVMALMGGVLGGIVIFGEWSGLVPEMVGLKIMAALTLLAGVLILSLRTRP